MRGLQELLASGKRLFEVDYTALKDFLAAANTQFEDGERLFYMYATRGIFYLTNNGYMTLIAIEMIDCPDPKKPDTTVRLLRLCNSFPWWLLDVGLSVLCVAGELACKGKHVCLAQIIARPVRLWFFIWLVASSRCAKAARVLCLCHDNSAQKVLRLSRTPADSSGPYVRKPVVLFHSLFLPWSACLACTIFRPCLWSLQSGTLYFSRRLKLISA